MKRFIQSHKALSLTIAIVLGLILSIALIAGYALFAPHYHPEKTSYIYIDHDDTQDSVLAKVARAGMTSNTNTLRRLMKMRDYKIHTGKYLIAPGDGNYTLFHRLASGQQTPVMLAVGSPRTVLQLARSIASQLEIDSAALATRLTDTAYCAKLGYTPQTIPSLFIPNSYEMYWDIDIDDFFARMQKEYDRFWKGERSKKAQKIGYTPAEVATIASIVDAETNYSPEKPKVAGLYINRLQQGMKLQSDPTVIFAIGDFSIRRVGGSQLFTNSPYNTYRYEGLPPGPIRIASIAGIDAVLDYDRHGYLYMCAKEDFSGSHNFATSWNEHQANATRYQKALNERNITLK